MSRDTTSATFFESMYRHNSDPWSFATSPYEQHRYAAIARAISHRRYRRALEPGCSIGILTEQLAAFCDQVEAMDISETAATRAAERCRRFPHVTVQTASLTEHLPTGLFDLVVLSEIGYYFTPQAWRTIAASLVKRIPSGGTLVAAHWLGSSPDHLASGDSVHQTLVQLSGLTLDHSERHPSFRLDRWRRA